MVKVELKIVREHIRLVGILNMIMGGLSALIGVTALVLLTGAAGIVHYSVPWGDSSDFMAAPILVAIGIGVASFFMILALPSLIGGWGLMHLRPWARVLMIIVSVFHLFHVPLGTALGVYGLWALLSSEGQRIFEQGALVYANSSHAPII